MNDTPYVKIAQEKLIAAGYDIKYGADGYFGGATQAAVEDFQQKNGLPVTSIVDAETWEALLK
jgi:peptidoglycan hydrolase-like protein with peptidoglycan-binding domain